jgi:hypothetical protein
LKSPASRNKITTNYAEGEAVNFGAMKEKKRREKTVALSFVSGLMRGCWPPKCRLKSRLNWLQKISLLEEVWADLQEFREGYAV